MSEQHGARRWAWDDVAGRVDMADERSDMDDAGRGANRSHETRRGKVLG